MGGEQKPLIDSVGDLVGQIVFWKTPGGARFINWSLNRRGAGFSERVDEQRLAAIRWRAARRWKAWHIHDVCFLLARINKLEAALAQNGGHAKVVLEASAEDAEEQLRAQGEA